LVPSRKQKTQRRFGIFRIQKDHETLEERGEKERKEKKGIHFMNGILSLAFLLKEPLNKK